MLYILEMKGSIRASAFISQRRGSSMIAWFTVNLMIHFNHTQLMFNAHIRLSLAAALL